CIAIEDFNRHAISPIVHFGVWIMLPLLRTINTLPEWPSSRSDSKASASALVRSSPMNSPIFFSFFESRCQTSQVGSNGSWVTAYSRVVLREAISRQRCSCLPILVGNPCYRSPFRGPEPMHAALGFNRICQFALRHWTRFICLRLYGKGVAMSRGYKLAIVTF